jgi:hypothetical protein
MTTYDVLVDNKHVYNFEYNVLVFFSIATKLVLIFFIIGLFQEHPHNFIEILMVIKVLLGIFLVYRFNRWRQHKITFTELDRRVAFSAGQYIILLAILDYVVKYVDEIRNFISPYTRPIVTKLTGTLRVPQNTFGVQG